VTADTRSFAELQALRYPPAPGDGVCGTELLDRAYRSAGFSTPSDLARTPPGWRPRRRFSNSKTIYPSVGKSPLPAALTDPADVAARVAEVTGGGYWSPSPMAMRAFDLFTDIAVGKCTSPQPSAELRTLVDDKLVIKNGAAYLVCDGGGRAEADPWPGWARPAGWLRPKQWKPGDRRTDMPVDEQRKEIRKLRLTRMPVDEQLERVKEIHRDLLATGMPDGITFPEKVMATFTRARKRGEVALPAWAWAALVNATLAVGMHPISRRTAASRMAKLLEDEELVMTRAPHTRYDPQARDFVTTPAAYAIPKPGLRGVVQRHRARRAARKAGAPPPSPKAEIAWRLQVEHWRERDHEAGWGA
jgi:hypothetical protein